MEIVGEAYVYGTDDWLKYLEGEGFCMSPSLGLTEEQVQGCQGIIKLFMPAAFKKMSGEIKVFSDRICNSWYDGICEA